MTGLARPRARLRVKLLLSQNFCNRPLMRCIRFASNIGPAAAVPAGPGPAPLPCYNTKAEPIGDCTTREQGKEKGRDRVRKNASAV